jgi:hypothetical protein
VSVSVQLVFFILFQIIYKCKFGVEMK